LKAFLDHGKPLKSLLEGINEAKKAVNDLAKLGIDLNAVTEQLQKEGVRSFSQSFDHIMDVLRGKCKIK
jgi:transaldolase